MYSSINKEPSDRAVCVFGSRVSDAGQNNAVSCDNVQTNGISRAAQDMQDCHSCFTAIVLHPSKRQKHILSSTVEFREVGLFSNQQR